MRLLQIYLATAITGHTVLALGFDSRAPEIDNVHGKRGSQYIFASCPEDKGKSPQKCSKCGGDSEKKGVCDKLLVKGYQGDRCHRPNGVCGVHCKCIHDGDDDDDNDGGVIPFPPVPPGFPAVPAGVPHPHAPKDGKEACQGDYTKRKCKDCDAKSGWCTTGEDTGCPCKEDCPEDDKRDKCSDDDCKGDDETKECTIGFHKGCSCKSDCPKKDNAPFCEEDACKGKEVKCTTGEHKGCECQKSVEIEIISHPGDAQWLSVQQKILEKIDSMSVPKPDDDDKPKEKPKCKAGGTGITGNDFSKARDEFCKKPSKKYNKDSFELALKKSGGDCPKDDCADTLNLIFNTCGDYASRPGYPDDEALDEHRGPLKGSGEAKGKCGTYTFKKSDPKPKFDPPGEDALNTWGQKWEVRCLDDSPEGRFKVDEDALDDVMDDFCKNGKTLNPSVDSSSFYEAKKFDDGYLIVSGSPASGSDAVDWYEDSSACNDFDGKIRADDCKKALKKIYKKCNPKGGDEDLYRGNWNYNCVSWTVDTSKDLPKKND